jgi:alanine racemase
VETSPFSTWLEIDTGAIRENTRRMRAITGKPLMAVIKANGYGHGLAGAARAALAGGAEWLAVARIEEALAARAAGIQSGILVLGYTPPARIPEAVAQRISLTVYDRAVCEQYAAAAGAGVLRVHMKVNTGMNRLGVSPEEAVELLRWLRAQPSFQVEAMFTHFSRSDEPQAETTARQLNRFVPLVENIATLGLRPPIIHAANSAASLYIPAAYFDLTRSGIALYGLTPSAEAPLPDGFSPALAWKALLTQVRVVPPGSPIGYGTNYTTSAEERIGVIPVGYADGYRRLKKMQVLLRGQRVNLVGRVCMDQCMLSLDALPDAAIGEAVTLIGAQGGDRIRAEELAGWWNTNVYDVACSLAERLPRVYR